MNQYPSSWSLARPALLAFAAVVSLPSLTDSVCRAGPLHAYASLHMEEFVHAQPTYAYPGFVGTMESNTGTFATVSYADPSIRGFATAEANPSRLVRAGVAGEYLVTPQYRDYALIAATAIWKDTLTVTGTDLPRVTTLRLNFHYSGSFPTTLSTLSDDRINGNGLFQLGIETWDTRSGGPSAGVGATIAKGAVESTYLGTGVDSLRLTASGVDVRYHLDLKLAANPQGTIAIGSYSDNLYLDYYPPSNGRPGGIGDPLTFDGVFQSATFLDGSTPESRGYTLTFESGMVSPNLISSAPTPPGLVLFAIGSAPLLGLNWHRRKIRG